MAARGTGASFSVAAAPGLVKARHAAADHRVREILDSLVDHLHAFVREVRPTTEEWASGVRFLADAGRISVGGREEFVLLSDILGVSMLVDALNNPCDQGETESTVLGPFYVPGTPVSPMDSSIAGGDPGPPLYVSGRVLDASGAPVDGAVMEVWQTASNGLYDVQEPAREGSNLRGLFQTGADGRYGFRTVEPVSYSIPDDGPAGVLLAAAGRHPMRPAHIHFRIAAPGLRTLVTHLFRSDDPYLASDTVFGVKDALVVTPEPHADANRAAALGLPDPFSWLRHDFVLAQARA